MKSFKEYLMENSIMSVWRTVKRTTVSEVNRRYGIDLLDAIGSHMKDNNMDFDEHDGIFLCPVESFRVIWNTMSRAKYLTAGWYDKGKVNVISFSDGNKFGVILDYYHNKQEHTTMLEIDKIQPPDNTIVIVDYSEENMHYV